MSRDEGDVSGAGSPGRRKRPPLVSRTQAIEAAYQLIAAEGPLGLSMRKLATALHVSLPTVYTAVDSRETLIGELQDRLVSEIAAAVALDRLSEGEEGLRAAGSDLLDWTRQRPYLAQFLIVEPMSALVVERAVERSTPEQRAAGRALLATLASDGDRDGRGTGTAAAGGPVGQALDVRGIRGVTALAFVVAEARGMLWLATQEQVVGAGRHHWLTIACANVARGLTALSSGQPTRH